MIDSGADNPSPLPDAPTIEHEIRARLGSASIVLVGLMGAGKSTIGWRLAERLKMPFIDADTAIEEAAGMSISDIFAVHGEAHFRDGERRVIARLLQDGGQVLATGGGAFISEQTREAIAQSGISIWLKADLDVLMKRVRKRSHRPLMRTADPEGTMRRLIDERYPVYALADITVMSHETPHEKIVSAVMDELLAFLRGRDEGTTTP